MTLKNFHILFPTKTNFLVYLAVMLYMRSLARVVAQHIGMTQRCLSVRLKGHATRLSSSAVGQHLSEREQVQYLASLQNQFTQLNDLPLPSDTFLLLRSLFSPTTKYSTQPNLTTTTFLPFLMHYLLNTINLSSTLVLRPVKNYIFLPNHSSVSLLVGSYFCILKHCCKYRFTQISLTSGHKSSAFSLRCIYLCCKVFYFILSDDDFEIKSKIYSFNLRLVLNHILHSQDDFFRNLFFTLFYRKQNNVLFSETSVKSHDLYWAFLMYCTKFGIETAFDSSARNQSTCSFIKKTPNNLLKEELQINRRKECENWPI